MRPHRTIKDKIKDMEDVLFHSEYALRTLSMENQQLWQDKEDALRTLSMVNQQLRWDKDDVLHALSTETEQTKQQQAELLHQRVTFEKPMTMEK